MANNLLSLMKPKSGNPYAIGGFSPRFINSMIEQGAKQELLAESKTLLPDEATLSKAIMDKDIFAGDKARYIHGLNNYTSRFLKEYKKDPYYAFTRDARDQIKQMKTLASDPNLIAMEQAKKTSDAEYEKAQKEGMDFNPVVRDGRMLVAREGRQQFIPMSQLQSGDTPISVSQQYSSAVNSGIGTTPISYDMTSWSDVLDRVTKAATNLGSEDFEQRVGNGLMERVKNQNAAAKERLEWLVGNGLSQADINTIQSEYVKRTGNVGSDTYAKSLEWLTGLTAKHLSSSLDTSVSTSVDPALEVKKKRAETANLTAPVGSYETMISSAIGIINEKLNQVGDTEVTGNIVVDMPSGFWDNQQYIGKSGVATGNLPLSQNPIFNNLRVNKEAPITIPDGVPINAADAVPDPTRTTSMVWKNGKRYLKIPVIYASDEYRNSAYQDSKFVGKFNPETNSYDKASVGESGESSNEMEALYTKVADLTENDDFGFSPMPHKSGVELFDDNIYQTEVLVEMHPDSEMIARLRLDDNSLYAPKELESAFSGSAVRVAAPNTMITR